VIWSRSARECRRDGGRGERIRISDEQLRVSEQHSIAQKIAELCLGPAVKDAAHDAVQLVMLVPSHCTVRARSSPRSV
jgi:hypothetical protein